MKDKKDPYMDEDDWREISYIFRTLKMIIKLKIVENIDFNEAVHLGCYKKDKKDKDNK